MRWHAWTLDRGILWVVPFSIFLLALTMFYDDYAGRVKITLDRYGKKRAIRQAIVDINRPSDFVVFCLLKTT
jgi:hypothetical protein